MKKSFKFILAALVCSSVLFACQREFSGGSEESPQPKSLTNVSTYKLISNPTTGAVVSVSVGIESTTGVVEITRSSTTPDGSERAAVYEYGISIYDYTDNKIEIPEDGQVYWFVPMDVDQEPQIMSGGEVYSGIECSCGNQTGDCGVDDNPGNGKCAECVNVTCSDCKRLECTADISGNVLSGSGILVGGNKIILDGIEYVGRTLASGASEDHYLKPSSGGSNSIKASISRSSNGQTVTITTSPSSNAPTAKGYFYDMGINLDNGGNWVIPNNGDKYWNVPLEGGGTPSVINGGTQLTIYTCPCLSGETNGHCNPGTDAACKPICIHYGCADCDPQGVVSTIIRANSIVLNGTTYN